MSRHGQKRKVLVSIKGLNFACTRNYDSNRIAMRGEQSKAMWLKEWHWEQRMFDIINDAMPERYKMQLEDRSYHADASRAGETMKEFVEDRKREPKDRQWGDYVGD